MKMRIVGMGNYGMIIQIMENGKWEQQHMNRFEFCSFMEKHFPEVAEQMGKMEDYYYYGETEEMRREGDAYIFESEE